MNDDEGDDSDIAPIPPYERQWRHPAEHADNERRLVNAAAAPPPISRRSRTLISAFAGAMAVAVFVVSVPKGINDEVVVGTDTTLPADTTWPSVPIKGLATNPAVVLAGEHGSTTALVIDGRTLITSLEEVTSRGTVWVTLPTGIEVEARITDADAQSGLALVRLVGSGQAGLTNRAIRLGAPTRAPSSLTDPDTLATLALVDWLGAQQPFADDGFTTSTDAMHQFVRTARAIAGVAAVTGAKGEVVGVAVRRAQATSVLTLDGVRDILTREFGIEELGN